MKSESQNPEVVVDQPPDPAVSAARAIEARRVIAASRGIVLLTGGLVFFRRILPSGADI
jgi:hypothetical protein